MYLWRNFDLTSELNVCHTCDVRHCFNPRHLWLGTQSENIVDGFRKGRMDRGEHHKNAKLSEKNVIAILRALDRGVNQTKLAARYSVAGSVISRIKTGTRWNYTWKAYHAAK
jgi:ribosome-binding protein aMBF1 (putative translation factor)